MTNERQAAIQSRLKYAGSLIEYNALRMQFIDDVATIIGECIDQTFTEGFVDFLEKPTADNALYVSKKLKTLFSDYIKDIE